MYRDVYSGTSKLQGEEHRSTLDDAFNYANSLSSLDRYAEAKVLLRKTIPVARRVLGENTEVTLRMRRGHAQSLYTNNGATLDNLREAVATLEDAGRIARRVFGGAYPLTTGIEEDLRNARAVLAARDVD